MTHRYSNGPEMIETSRTTNRILQVGSQPISSVVYEPSALGGNWAAVWRKHFRGELFGRANFVSSSSSLLVVTVKNTPPPPPGLGLGFYGLLTISSPGQSATDTFAV